MSAAARFLARELHPRRALRTFVGVALIALVGVAVGAVVVARAVAQDESLRAAERTAVRLGELVVAPLLAEALRGSADRLEELERAMAIRLRDGSLNEVTVWDRDGTVVYSTVPAAVGRVFPVSDEVVGAIAGGTIASEVGMPEGPGARGGPERYVEVYAPMEVEGRGTLAIETYVSADRLDDQSASLAGRLVLLTLLPLVALQAVQVPIAISLSRRVRRHDRERADLLARALSASDRERRSIAADLHDGVVQELAGTSYALAALTRHVPESERRTARAVADAVSTSVDGLRRLMVDLYPPELSGPGLAVALDDLARPLRAAGTEVELSVGPLPDLDPPAAATVYRVAREALANVAKHANARHVVVELSGVDGDAVLLRIVDDGVGVGDAAAAEGHFGVQMMRDRVADAGGRFRLGSPPGGTGTMAEALVPHAPG